MFFQILLVLAALLLNTVEADVRDSGPQTFIAPAPQYAQRYKEVIMYLTPTQIRNYEAGHGLPSPPPENPSYTYEQQKPEQEIPLNDEEGRIIQSTLDILEANKMQFQQQQNNPNIEITKAHESQSEDFKPIAEPNAEEPPTRLYPVEPQKPQQYEDQPSKEQENVAKSYAYVHFFSNEKPGSAEKIQIFHPEPHNVNLDEEIRLQKEKNIEIQQDPLLRQKFKLIPYEFIADQEIHERVKEQLNKPEKQPSLQLFVPEPTQQKANKDKPIPKNENIHQYAPQFTSLNTNVDLEKNIKEIQLEREAYRIHAENIAKSPPVVIHKDIKIIRRRPVPVTKHINVPYPAPFFVPVPNPVEVKVPQPYAVPIEIVRHVPVPIVRTETVEVEKPVPYEVEKHVPEIVEKKVYVPVEKPYTVERFIPVEVKKEIPIEIPVHRPEKFTIIRHVWKH